MVSIIHRRFAVLAGCAGVMLGAVLGVPVMADDAAPAGSVSFNRDILPILSDKCFHCHGPDDKHRRADIRLDSREGLFHRIDRETVVVEPGSPDGSELFRRLTSEDPDDRMPPPETKKPMSASEIDVFRRWILEGAEWEGHWSFITPRRPALPATDAAGWGRTPIDRFVARRLEREGFTPSPEADRRTLIRRVALDLTGLPPTPEEVEAFVEDPDDRAYEKVVDRLLASVRFGERMALAWMDAARYGDSSVFHADGPRDMWPWRDWVIEAYNDNKPFDQFTVEQIAGDLLPDARPADKVASGFNRNHGTTDEGGAIDEEYRVEYVVDRVKTTSRIWLGLTMECSQCHDHKYDPISQKEYYRFYAFFNQTKDKGMQTRNGNAEPLVRLFTPMQQDRLQTLRLKLAELRAERDGSHPARETVLAWAAEQRAALPDAPPEPGAWKQLGPFQAANPDEGFSKDFGPENDLDLDRIYGELRWTEAGEFKDGEVNALSLGENSSLYLARTLTAARPGPVGISLGSDDSLKVWLNGKSVLENNTRRGAAPDQDQATLDLVEGENWLLLKIGNAGGDAGFYFSLSGSGLPAEIEQIIRLADTEWSDDDFKRAADYYAGNVWPEGLSLAASIKNLQDEESTLVNAAPTSMVMEDQEEPRMTYVLNRGNYASPIESEVMLPGVPAALLPMSDGAPANRLGLARWLVDPRHPLTARVTVNRYWQMFFGTGLVATVADFGTRGDWPSHPALLDWLARDFVDNGWDIKRTIKQMLMSATYRQSSRISPELLARDPENRWLARGPRFRLQGEFIRDQALAVSGLLNGQVGGPSVKPYQPDGIWNEVSLDGNLRYQRDSGEKLFRRGMYIFWKRSAPMPSMLAFDAPTREKCVIQRQRTNTPLQALVTLNDVQFVEAARVFAERILSEGGDDFEARIDRAFLLATARPADAVRRSVMRDLYERQLAVFTANPERAREFLEYGEYRSGAERDAAEHAAWTVVASALLNLDEVLTRD